MLAAAKSRAIQRHFLIELLENQCYRSYSRIFAMNLLQNVLSFELLLLLTFLVALVSSKFYNGEGTVSFGVAPNPDLFPDDKKKALGSRPSLMAQIIFWGSTVEPLIKESLLKGHSLFGLPVPALVT